MSTSDLIPSTKESLPIIDLAQVPQDLTQEVRGPDKEAVLASATQLHQAFQETGFAYIRHHGIDEALVAAIVTDARDFFAAPLERKMAIAMPRAGRAWRGYFQVGAELTAGAPDQKEGLYLGVEHPPDAEGVVRKWPMHGANQWPDDPGLAQLKPNLLQYIEALTALGHRLMALVGAGLGLPIGYFRERFSHDPTTLLRLFNYPAQPQHTDAWGVGQHTDMGFLTILLQDESGGLQVKARQGHWIDAPPLPGTFVINIGDMLQHWTHGIYKASLHRVRNVNNRDRLSIPFFFDPTWTCPLAPTDPALLPTTALAKAAQDPHRSRWDGLDLRTLPHDMTYGDFVWSKIKNVFPALAAATSEPREA